MIFGFSLLFVFLILAALYESWTLPFSVLLSTPVAVFGAFGVLWLRRVVLGWFLPAYMVQIENDVYSQIGLVMLIGLAAKNAILIVEFAKDEFEKGKHLVDAALEGARLRLRPILMTSFAFILGCVPLWTASGAGSVARQIMGTTVIGGMLAASVIGIFFIPAIFYVVEKLSGASKEARPRSLPPTPAPARGRLTCEITDLPLLSLAAILLAGCTVGPNYQRPAVQTPATFRAPDRPRRRREPASLADLKWLEVFKDEKLQELIRTALVQNYDLRDAAARVEAARAQSGHHAIRSISAMSAPARTSGRSRASRGMAQSPLPAIVCALAESHVWGEPTLNLLSFEVDIWGRLRRATEAARANLLGAEENRKAVMTTLVSDVASVLLQPARTGLRTGDFQRDAGHAPGIAASDPEPPDRRSRDAVSTCARANNWCTRPRKPFPPCSNRSSRPRTRSACCWGGIPAASSAGASLTEQELPPECPPVCLRRCSSAGRISARPSRI